MFRRDRSVSKQRNVLQRRISTFSTTSEISQQEDTSREGRRRDAKHRASPRAASIAESAKSTRSLLQDAASSVKRRLRSLSPRGRNTASASTKQGERPLISAPIRSVTPLEDGPQHATEQFDKWKARGTVRNNKYIAQMNEEEIIRQEALEELMVTEVKYLEDLQELQRLRVEGQSILCEFPEQTKTWTALFGPLPTLIELSERFLQSLRQSSTAGVMVDCVTPLSLTVTKAFEEAYTNYCTVNVDEKVKHLDALLADTTLPYVLPFTQRILQHDEQWCKNFWSITALFARPTARLLKYVLLYQLVLKHTAKTHPDAGRLALILSSIRQIAENTNTLKAAQEDMEKLTALQSALVASKEEKAASPLAVNGRRLFLVAQVTHLTDKGNKKTASRGANGQIVLCNDALFIGRFVTPQTWQIVSPPVPNHEWHVVEGYKRKEAAATEAPPVHIATAGHLFLLQTSTLHEHHQLMRGFMNAGVRVQRAEQGAVPHPRGSPQRQTSRSATPVSPMKREESESVVQEEATEGETTVGRFACRIWVKSETGGHDIMGSGNMDLLQYQNETNVPTLIARWYLTPQSGRCFQVAILPNVPGVSKVKGGYIYAKATNQKTYLIKMAPTDAEQVLQRCADHLQLLAKKEETEVLTYFRLAPPVLLESQNQFKLPLGHPQDLLLHFSSDSASASSTLYAEKNKVSAPTPIRALLLTSDDVLYMTLKAQACQENDAYFEGMYFGQLKELSEIAFDATTSTLTIIMPDAQFSLRCTYTIKEDAPRQALEEIERAQWQALANMFVSRFAARLENKADEVKPVPTEPTEPKPQALPLHRQTTKFVAALPISPEAESDDNSSIRSYGSSADEDNAELSHFLERSSRRQSVSSSMALSASASQASQLSRFAEGEGSTEDPRQPSLRESTLEASTASLLPMEATTDMTMMSSSPLRGATSSSDLLALKKQGFPSAALRRSQSWHNDRNAESKVTMMERCESLEMENRELKEQLQHLRLTTQV